MKEAAEQSAALFLRKFLGTDLPDFADERVKRRRGIGSRVRRARRCLCGSQNVLQIVERVRMRETFLIEAVGEHHVSLFILIGQREERM